MFIRARGDEVSLQQDMLDPDSSESVTPGLGVVVDINWKMIQERAVTISR